MLQGKWLTTPTIYTPLHTCKAKVLPAPTISMRRENLYLITPTTSSRRLTRCRPWIRGWMMIFRAARAVPSQSRYYHSFTFPSPISFIVVNHLGALSFHHVYSVNRTTSGWRRPPYRNSSGGGDMGLHLDSFSHTHSEAIWEAETNTQSCNSMYLCANGDLLTIKGLG
jgi:hypothetical protein